MEPKRKTPSPVPAHQRNDAARRPHAVLQLIPFRSSMALLESAQMWRKLADNLQPKTTDAQILRS